jgi:hypothetical protein
VSQDVANAYQYPSSERLAATPRAVRPLSACTAEARALAGPHDGGVTTGLRRRRTLGASFDDHSRAVGFVAGNVIVGGVWRRWSSVQRSIGPRVAAAGCAAAAMRFRSGQARQPLLDSGRSPTPSERDVCASLVLQGYAPGLRSRHRDDRKLKAGE